jgi:hypothetical protein
VVVSVLAGHSEELGTSCREKVVKFSGGITVVVTVRLLVTNSEDSNLLIGKVEFGEDIVEPVIPAGSGALLVGTSVPSGGTDDKSISSGDIIIAGIIDVNGFGSSGFGDVSGNGFGVSGGGGVVKSNSVQGGGGRGLVHGRSESFGGGQEGGDDGGVAGKHDVDYFEFVCKYSKDKIVWSVKLMLMLMLNEEIPTTTTMLRENMRDAIKSFYREY